VDRITSFSGYAAQIPVFSLDLSEPGVDYGYVSSSVVHLYHYCLVNNGNQSLALSGFSLSPPSVFTFANGTGGNSTLLPGESRCLDIALLTPTSPAINGTLTFNTGIAAQPTMTVPLHSDGASPVGIAAIKRPALLVYPNPVENWLIVENPQDKARLCLTDATGRIVRVTRYDEEGRSRFDCTCLAAGLYFLCDGTGAMVPVMRP
jgi:hypothetical protein